ncbi:large conductance mechanosensitive channel protein MscL [Azospirillum halopraeferens]|uniref:large conductance mechanosensitive channel protein MscL n=1 Tax=Azospirillum halopraeferens TaxID=34010 RepID=UPI00041F77FD|nr:large conductance mechanosensitive channel protein MscL [Azospirillum halopraeferens]
MWQEFRAFISRGNVIDLAVGIVIGAAFTGIVNSLVNDILTPPIGWIMGGLDFSNHFLNLSGGTYDSLAAAQAAGAATINYGRFLNAILHFLIVAGALFLLVRKINRFRRSEPAEPDEPPAPPRQETLLEEIRDLLRDPPSTRPPA